MIRIETNKKGNLKCLHVGDLHLGRIFSDFKSMDTQAGLNKMLVEQIKYVKKVFDIAIEEDVAAVILPGDIYDRVSNIPEKLRNLFQEQLLRLRNHDIASILLIGNHDFPKSRDFKALIARYNGLEDYIHTVPVYKARYEQININDEILVHAIPWCFTKEDFKKEFDKAQYNHDFKVNILTTHTAVLGANIQEYDKHTEGWLNKAEFEQKFDYVALGDFHKPYKISERVYYAGALCKNTFAERNFDNLVLVFDGEDKSVKPIKYKVRGMEYHPIKCINKDPEKINEELYEIIENADKEKYIKIELFDITKEQKAQLDIEALNNFRKDCYYLKRVFNIITREDANNTITSTSTEVKSVKEEIADALRDMTLEAEKIKDVMTLFETEIDEIV